MVSTAGWLYLAMFTQLLDITKNLLCATLENQYFVYKPETMLDIHVQTTVLIEYLHLQLSPSMFGNLNKNSANGNECCHSPQVIQVFYYSEQDNYQSTVKYTIRAVYGHMAVSYSTGPNPALDCKLRPFMQEIQELARLVLMLVKLGLIIFQDMHICQGISGYH